MKALVTGAAGFLGGHLVEMLVERGDEVRALIQPGQNPAFLQTLPGVEVVEGDLTDASSLIRAVQGMQRVYHIAAQTGPWGPEAAYNAANVQGVLDLLAAAMDAGVERIVHTSSITVYGHHLHGIVTEDHPYHAEDNPYSRTRISSEKLIFQQVKERGAAVVIIRPAWIYGPRDTTSFGRLVKLIDAGKGFMLGNGKNIVPVVYVRDVAQGLLKAGDAGNHAVGRAYTIANDQHVTQEEYLNLIADELEVSHISRRYPYSAMYLAGWLAEAIWKVKDRQRQTPPPVSTYNIALLGSNRQFSIDRARRELGYAPAFDVKRGVEEGIAWYLGRQSGKASQNGDISPVV
jgi:nucleoside-diphosphate-sugar epimerase